MISALASEEEEVEEGKVCIIVITERVMHFWTFLIPRIRFRGKKVKTRTVTGSEASVSPARVSLFYNLIRKPV